ncbi:MAG: zinc finger HIT domain-containing protein [Deltaproteobacteria bacterium]|nr:zinc finger HIT domain-containing protein [Deltaproteobacteria bacterium]
MNLRRGRFGAGQCAICGEGHKYDCARCGADLCSEHAHGDNDRCTLCESEYETSYSVKDGALYMLTMLACPSLLMLAVVGALSVPTVGTYLAVAISVGTLAGVAKGFPAARKALAEGTRSRFLAENSLPGARLLSERSSA